MTIILATTTLMLADSLCRWDYTRTQEPQKIHRLHGGLLGAAGELGRAQAYVRWYTKHGGEHEVEEAEIPGTEAFTALLLTAAGGLSSSNGDTCIPLPIYEEAWAIGSGRELALGALWAGASLLAAMAVACERGVDCGWPVRWYGLDGEEGVVTREQWRDVDGIPLGLQACLFAPGAVPLETSYVR